MGRQATRELMRRHDIRPTHSLGQNFLVEANILDEIVAAAELTRADFVLEIGPGLGHLTCRMAKAAGQVVAIEIDRHLLPALAETTAACENVRILHADARQVDLVALRAEWPGPQKVIANLPYYITTPLIIKVLTEWPTAERLVLTIQNEAADRILAKPGQSEYGPLAILCQLYGTPRKKRVIPADAFLPRPNVDSCLIILTASPLRPMATQWPQLARFLPAAFLNRRKKLRNVLASLPAPMGPVSRERIETAWQALKLSDNARAEELLPAQWYALFLALQP